VFCGNRHDAERNKPASLASPFQATAKIGPNPWDPDTRLLQIGIKGYGEKHQSHPSRDRAWRLDARWFKDIPDPA